MYGSKIPRILTKKPPVLGSKKRKKNRANPLGGVLFVVRGSVFCFLWSIFFISNQITVKTVNLSLLNR